MLGFEDDDEARAAPSSWSRLFDSEEDSITISSDSLRKEGISEVRLA